MNILYNKLQQIKQKPALYLGKKSLPLLQAYLNGYVAYHNDTNNEEDYFFLPELRDYIIQHYNIDTSHGWPELITFFSSNDNEAFDKFYELLDDFFSKNTD
ncbi:hypothetical protein B5M42_004915 [Paenibacillus athensensis]|nr:hypothetical protein [Paenibacillus athensensis]MCD1258180.1 hypothetical protein [Paenibacillus athensensis]